jgi:hypothetical protein
LLWFASFSTCLILLFDACVALSQIIKQGMLQ